MKSKKGLEMSIGMIVLLIISILIFLLSVTLVFKWFQGAQEIQKGIDQQTEQQIRNSLSGNTLIANPFPLQIVKRGNHANYGIGIRNIGEDAPFMLSLQFSGAYAPDGTPICNLQQPCADYIQKNWLGNLAIHEPFKLKKNEQRIEPIIIFARTNMEQSLATKIGDYVFNICVYQNPPTTLPSCTVNSGLNTIYTNKIYQVTVRVR